MIVGELRKYIKFFLKVDVVFLFKFNIVFVRGGGVFGRLKYFWRINYLFFRWLEKERGLRGREVGRSVVFVDYKC